MALELVRVGAQCSLALLVVALGVGRLVDGWLLCSLLGPMASRCGLLHPGTPLSRHVVLKENCFGS